MRTVISIFQKFYRGLLEVAVPRKMSSGNTLQESYWWFKILFGILPLMNSFSLVVTCLLSLLTLKSRCFDVLAGANFQPNGMLSMGVTDILTPRLIDLFYHICGS